MAKPEKSLRSTGVRKPSNRGRMADGQPNPVDVHVGERIRLARTLRGLSQEKLGEGIGLTFQQVQKYERGSNRVSASRLVDLANALDLPVSFFFDQLDLPQQMPPGALGMAEPGKAYQPAQRADAPSIRERQDLMSSYEQLPEAVRRKVFELVKSLAEDARKE